MSTNVSERFAWIRVDSWANRLPTYRIANFWFLRALGLVYFCAFASLWTQVDGLIGSDGILPIAPLIDEARTQIGYVDFPTLCWITASDASLHAQCAIGVLLSISLMAGILPALCTTLLWLLYLSLTVAGQLFLGFQWDNLLLETGLIAIFLSPLVMRSRLSTDPPPSRVAVFLVQALLFKLMFLSGFVKWSSGDPSWRDLTALTYHYWTTCLPVWPGWYVHKLPLWFHKFSCAVMFACEFALPFLIWGPGRMLKRITFFGLVGFQLVIWFTGNYTFFNLLTMALCLLVLDDNCFRIRGSASRARGNSWPAWIVGPLAIPILIISLLIFTNTLRWRLPWPNWTAHLYQAVSPFRSINGYGLFAAMTKERIEIIVEGSNDGETWTPYEFKWKPGDLKHRPGFVAPHQPRLDWQMWFAALSDIQHQRWLLAFMAKLLEGSPAVLDLLQSNPFPDHPPHFIRAVAYDYRFSTWAERRIDGTWWTRERRGLYCPAIALRNATL